MMGIWIFLGLTMLGFCLGCAIENAAETIATAMKESK